MMTAIWALVLHRQKSMVKGPQCVLCVKVLASECMLPNKLKGHLETAHPSVVSKSHDCFSRKLKELNQQKGSFLSRHQYQAMLY
jgi:hypothetical protein